MWRWTLHSDSTSVGDVGRILLQYTYQYICWKNPSPIHLDGIVAVLCCQCRSRILDSSSSSNTWKCYSGSVPFLSVQAFFVLPVLSLLYFLCFDSQNVFNYMTTITHLIFKNYYLYKIDQISKKLPQMYLPSP